MSDDILKLCPFAREALLRGGIVWKMQRHASATACMKKNCPLWRILPNSDPNRHYGLGCGRDFQGNQHVLEDEA